MNYAPYNAEIAANIDRSTDIPRLEEIVRDCTRAIRHSNRVVKYCKAPSSVAEATERLAGYTAKKGAAHARLAALGC